MVKLWGSLIYKLGVFDNIHWPLAMSRRNLIFKVTNLEAVQLKAIFSLLEGSDLKQHAAYHKIMESIFEITGLAEPGLREKYRPACWVPGRLAWLP